MKKIFLILILTLIFSIALAKKHDEFPSNMTLSELAEKTKIPIKKLKNILSLELTTSETATLEKLMISQNDIEKATQKYEKNKNSYYGGIVLVGMLIVFASLLTVGLIISQLKRLQIKEKKSVSTPQGKITASQNISQNDIVAVITAIFLHEMEADEQNKLLLTWKRSAVSMWKAAGKIDYPNRTFFEKK